MAFCDSTTAQRSTALTVKPLGLIVISLLVLANPLSLAEDEPTYNIATVEWIGWSFLQVADSQGFWRDQGVDVEVVTYDEPTVVLEAVLAGRCQFAMDMVGSVAGQHMMGRPVVALAETNWSHGGDKVIVKRGHDIAGLKGQPLGVFLNLPSCLYFLHLCLNQHGLDIEDFRIVEIKADDLAEQFIAGRIPAILVYDPFAIRAILEGDGQIVATSASFEGCVPECIWTYKENLEALPREDVIKILRGIVEASKWLNDESNWAEFAQILNTKTFSGHRTYNDEELKRLLDGVRIHGPERLIERNRPDGGLSSYLDSLHAFLKKNGLLRKDFAAADLFDNRFIMEVLTPGDGLEAGTSRPPLEGEEPPK